LFPRGGCCPRRENGGSCDTTSQACLSMSSRDTAKGEKATAQRSKVGEAVEPACDIAPPHNMSVARHGCAHMRLSGRQPPLRTAQLVARQPRDIEQHEVRQPDTAQHPCTAARDNLKTVVPASLTQNLLLAIHEWIWMWSRDGPSPRLHCAVTSTFAHVFLVGEENSALRHVGRAVLQCCSRCTTAGDRSGLACGGMPVEECQ
jgi:hypothetical protein